MQAVEILMGQAKLVFAQSFLLTNKSETYVTYVLHVKELVNTRYFLTTEASSLSFPPNPVLQITEGIMSSCNQSPVILTGNKSNSFQTNPFALENTLGKVMPMLVSVCACLSP